MGECYRRLRLGEREEISRGLAQGKSLRAIARDLKRHVSTISRDVGAGESVALSGDASSAVGPTYGEKPPATEMQTGEEHRASSVCV